MDLGHFIRSPSKKELESGELAEQHIVLVQGSYLGLIPSCSLVKQLFPYPIPQPLGKKQVRGLGQYLHFSPS